MSDPEKPSFRPRARRPRGLADRRGPGLAAERALIAKISAVYEAWGFEPLETSAFEYADALGKFLPDQDRPNEGVFALQDDDEQWLALRYDLTAPLARFTAEHFDALPKPYRRWAAGPVWRNEKPGPGRFREFWQCDADTVGSASPAADAEMIAMACAALEAAGVSNYELKFSSRKLLDGLLETIELQGDRTATRMTVLRAIDKLDRLGFEGVEQLLGEGRKDESGDFTRGAGLDEADIAGVHFFLAASVNHSRQATLNKLSELLESSRAGAEGLRELGEISEVLGRLGVSDMQAVIDTTVVRGLEYYTGAVFEAQAFLPTRDERGNIVRFGAIGGGGRYDDLVSRFRGEPIPATGFSIGVSRLAAALAAAEGAKQADGPIVVLPFDKEGMGECFALAARLRDAGFRAEVYLGGAGPKAQLKYADKRGAPAAVILGGDERKEGNVTIKDLKLGALLAKDVADNEAWRKGRPAQQTVPQAEMVAVVQAIMKGA